MNNKIGHALLVIAVVILPFVCIGSWFFSFPRFIKVYGDIIGPSPLPNLTERIIEVPLWVWLAISTVLSTLNVLNLLKFQKTFLSVISAGITMVIPIIIIVGLFLPLQITIESLSHGEIFASEPDDADNPVKLPKNPKNHTDD